MTLKPEIIEGLGQYKVGCGGFVTDWHNTPQEALSAFNDLVAQKSPMWAAFWRIHDEDHFEICDSEADARAKLSQLIAEELHLECAGIAPIVDSTEHWHV